MDSVVILPFQVFLCAFCPVVSAPAIPYTAAEITGHGGVSREQLIAHYFLSGYTAYEIIAFLCFRHDIAISLRHLRRVLRRLGLRRREESDLEDVIEVMVSLLNDTSNSLGYRFMWRLLTTQYNFRVSQHTVRQLLRAIDPEGVRLRTLRRFRRRRYISRGPNYLIHIDGFDKLKPFGISVHAAIDGFSRRILWIQAGPSNKNPRNIAYLFLELIERLQGVPKIVRADRGTENSLVRDIQIALRQHHNDSFRAERSFLYGRSTANQRIEAWWSQLKRLSGHEWINFFKDLRDAGIFDTSDDIHIECARFAFMSLIQRDFSRIAEMWNQHRIRRQPNVECPPGKPDVMYFLPEVYDTRDCKRHLHYSAAEIQQVKTEYCEPFPAYGCSSEFEEVLTDLIGDVNRYALPSTREEAFDIFCTLVEILE